ncbi:exonuclease SbcCD subunit D [Motiliproteus sp. SC1-56]|uniref:exonuclease SbcCD subunit D n=1 Tax=Motiliproteus sp. SC1-56 TaxID=2799565 RepID=UPI001A8BF86A|nr:exonuclease SbcCD subunit D [Motiliproteus sp. SC1-56]
MRFIHTSDWHIGRQFHSQSLLDDQRQVLEQLLEHIDREAVDALVVAGDVYDRSVPPAAAVELLDDLLHRITEERGVPVVMIPGNHDSAERLAFGARQLRKAGLHIVAGLGESATPVTLGGVDFYGIPYNDPERVRACFGCAVKTHDEAHRFLVERIEAQTQTRARQVPRVLVSHCFIDGAEESESERPLSIGGADRVDFRPLVDFDYVALGHLHSPQYRGREHIRYAGSLLKYSFSEQHQKKGVTLVDIDPQAPAGERVQTRLLPLSPPRDMRVIEGELAELLERGRTDPHHQDYLLVRLTDRHALLDPMGKLRAVYPNVLQLEKPGMLETGEQRANREQLKRGELAMFRDFFSQVTGRALADDQDAALRATLERLQREGDA